MTGSYQKEITLAAARSTVRDALTTVEGLAGWWTPAVSGSAGRGGEVTFGFGDQRVVMHVDEADADRVAWTCVRHSKFPEWVGTRLSFELRPEGDAVLLSFEHAGLVPSLLCYPDCSAGWAHYLTSLSAYTATGRGMPWGEPGWQPARSVR